MVAPTITSTYALTSNLAKKARLLALAGDETRIRILYYMYDHREACVTDIARALKLKIGSVSHHLQIMRDNGVFKTKRLGNRVCYILINNDFAKSLKRVICQCRVCD